MSYAVFRWSVPYQSLVGFCFALWTAAVFATSIHELSLVLAIDYGDSIPVLQKKLIDLKLTIVKYLRLSVWVFPLYFGFIMLIFDLFFGIDIVAKGDPTWLLANGIFSIVVFIPMAIWMHTKLTTKNVNKPWMQKILGGNGRQVNDALSLLKEIEAYDKDKP